MCLTVGMIGGPYVKGMVGKVKETPVRSVTFHANLERIAVINLDTGVEKKGEQIYYAAKLIEYPDESYQTSWKGKTWIEIQLEMKSRLK